MRKSETQPPSAVSPPTTRDALLQAGIRLFSERGYDGVAVDEIVAAAQVNKRMVYHYFVNKEGLYLEVLKLVFDRLSRLEMTTFDDTLSVTELIRRLMKLYFEFLSSNPEFVQLLAWENLHRGKFIAEHPGLLRKTPLLEQFERVVGRGIDEGTLRKGIRTKHLLISMIGLCYIYHANRYTLSESMGINLNSRSELNEGLEQATAVLLSGVLQEGKA